jgi:DNA-binding NarL/FixJ family response regulator
MVKEYADESFRKGLWLIPNGQLWLWRQVMTSCVLENEGKASPSETGSSVLSRGEVEILAHMAIGFNNQEIAGKLCVSPHTVHTCVYNICKKINAPNRLQAVLWAAKNL